MFVVFVMLAMFRRVVILAYCIFHILYIHCVPSSYWFLPHVPYAPLVLPTFCIFPIWDLVDMLEIATSISPHGL